MKSLDSLRHQFYVAPKAGCILPRDGMKSDLIKMLEADGWRQVRMRGSHRQFRHVSKPGTITVAGNAN
ncbi:MAG: type II toxin-antitoxin system HicA family toxin, partial [Syntrophobacteraceae bacterium]|nr:type II toxin-antitoxin system HicA family toxin [Syntrophobacteraceae bacterium]